MNKFGREATIPLLSDSWIQEKAFVFLARKKGKREEEEEEEEDEEILSSS